MSKKRSCLSEIPLFGSSRRTALLFLYSFHSLGYNTGERKTGREVIQMRQSIPVPPSMSHLLKYKYGRSILLYSVAIVTALVLVVGLLFSALYNA